MTTQNGNPANHLFAYAVEEYDAPNGKKAKPPWRAEGLPGTPGGRPKINWWRFGLTLLAVYAAFFFISSFFDRAPVETVSYTQFTQQVLTEAPLPVLVSH